MVVREKILELQTSIIHIATEEMVADPLTKGLPPKVFKEHVTQMRLVESFDVTFEIKFRNQTISSMDSGIFS